MATASSNPSSVVSAGTWTSGSNTYANDSVYATNIGTAQNTEYALDVGGFNFAAIPSGSTINSVTVTIEAKAGNANRAQIKGELYDGATPITGTLALTTLTTTDTNYTFTPAATLAQLKSANLLVRVTNKRTVSQATTTSVDYVKIDVDYTPPPPAITQAAYRFYADGTESGSTALASQDTAPVVDVSGGDANLQVRVRLQETVGNAVPSTDDFQLQFERNGSGTWNDVTSGLYTVYASNPVAGGQSSLGDMYPNLGKGMTLTGTGHFAKQVSFGMFRDGSPTGGTISAEIFPMSGSLPAADPLTTSTTTYPPEPLPTSGFAWRDFAFDGTTMLAAGVKYAAIVRWTGGTGSMTNEPNVATSNVDGPNDHVYETSTDSWSRNLVTTLIYAVYGQPNTVVPFDSANLTNGAATSGRLTGGTGSFVAGKVSEDGLADDVGWSGSNYTELLYPISLKSADLVDGDTLRFRVLKNGLVTDLTYSQYPTVNITKGAGPAVAVTQAAYRFYETDSGETGSTPKAAQDTGFTADLRTLGDDIQVRFLLQSTSSTAIASTTDFRLQYRRNAGTWTDVTGASTIVTAYAYAAVTEGQATTNQLTGGTGTFAAGKVSEDGLVDDLGWSGNNYTEVMFPVTLQTAGTADGDVLEFRVLLDGATTGMTYSKTPTITVTKSLPKIETITTDFTNTSVWEHDPEVDVTTTTATINIDSTSPRVDTLGKYNLKGSSVFWKIDQLHTQTSASVQSVFELRVNGSSANQIRFLISSATTTVYMRHIIASTSTNLANYTWSASRPWLKFSESGGVAYWHDSADGVTWTQQASWTHADALDLTNVQLFIQATDAANNAGTGDTIISHVNVPGTGGTAATATGSITLDGSATAKGAITAGITGSVTLGGTVSSGQPAIPQPGSITLGAALVTAKAAVVSTTGSVTLGSAAVTAKAAITAGVTGSVTLGGTATSGQPPSSYQAAVLADSPLAYWRLGEASGSTATDSSGLGHHGTYGGSPGYGAAGALTGDSNTAIAFSGDDSVAIPDHADLDFTRTSTFTIEYWFKSTTNAYMSSISKLTGVAGNYGGWEVHHYADDATFNGEISPRLIANWGTNDAVAVNTTVSYNDGNWHHFVATYNGNSSYTGWTLYMDGAAVPMGTAENKLSVSGNTTNAEPLKIGARPDNTSWFTGGLDEVAVYGTVLSASRVKVHYDAGKGIVAATGRPTIWTGSAWAQKPLLIWTGSAWVEKQVRIWTGSEWKVVS